MLSWQFVLKRVAVRFLCFNLRYCHRVVLHELKATISIAAIELLMLCADDARLLMPVCVGDTQKDDAELTGSVDASGTTITIAAIESLIQCVVGVVWNHWSDRHVVRSLGGDSQTSVRLGDCGRTLLSWQVVWTSAAVLFGTTGSLHMWFGSLWRPAGVFAFRGLWQDDAELAGRVDVSGTIISMTPVESLLGVWGKGESVTYKMRRLVPWHVDGEVGEEYAAHCTQSVSLAYFVMRLFADGAHMLMPVCVGDYQQELFGTTGLIDMWFGVLWRLAGVRAFRRLWQVDAELACSVDVSGSLFHGMWIMKWLCADGAHLLMPVYVGDVQKVGCARQVRRPCVRRQSQDDADLAGPLESSGSAVSMLYSALLWSCCIACAQSNDISSSNRSAYVSFALMVRVC
ncbi:hypothetical protein cyc_00009 [Cyclospora cayetanensis]|uniref:Uncharacterized protein n=1 Tax=Cyclospora cayetanensis TaxID=88456 RepID=A0A1D3DA71_9EIME|nr:hypothetical protein cyc_00009 [Cyclospora cayetanensis]